MAKCTVCGTELATPYKRRITGEIVEFTQISLRLCDEHWDFFVSKCLPEVIRMFKETPHDEREEVTTEGIDGSLG